MLEKDFNKNLLKISPQYHNDILLPKQIEINIIAKCDLRCPFCPVSNKFYESFNYKTKYMTHEIFEKIINDLKYFNYEGEISFSGWGEPLLNSNILNFISLTKEKLSKSKITLMTNGNNLNTNFLKDLDYNGLDFLFISMYEGDHQISYFNYMIEKSMFKNVVLRNRYDNFHTTNRGGFFQKEKTYYKHCYYPFYSIFIDLDGDILFCVHNWNKENIMGNVIEDSILNIWNNFYNIRKLIINDRAKINVCKKCDVEGTKDGKFYFDSFKEQL